MEFSFSLTGSLNGTHFPSVFDVPLTRAILPLRGQRWYFREGPVEAFTLNLVSLLVRKGGEWVKLIRVKYIDTRYSGEIWA